jgi:hypothetical protein
MTRARMSGRSTTTTRCSSCSRRLRRCGHPGPRVGFSARAAGAGEVTLTSIARPGGGAPNVQRLSVQCKIL